jgi:hypothetical protein
MNELKDVNSKKFDALVKKGIDLRKCPNCYNIGGEIVIPLICYGKKWRRVYARCDYCGFETKGYDANTRLNDTESTRYGNIVLDKSLMTAIRNAVNDWNRRANDGT